MNKEFLKLLSEKPGHLDFQEKSRLVRNWKQNVTLAIKKSRERK